MHWYVILMIAGSYWCMVHVSWGIDNGANFVWLRMKWYSKIYGSLFSRHQWVNTLRPRRNSGHFSDDIFNSIFLNENVWTPIKISLKFVPKGLINNISALVHIMAWRRPGDKPLSEPVVVNLLMHICVTQPQWVNIGGYCFIFNLIKP